MHRDLIEELAGEFTDELLTCGVENNTVCRMIERTIARAVEQGSHMAIGDVWRLAGGSPDLAPDMETVTAALRALQPVGATPPKPLDYSAIEEAVLRVGAGNFSDGRDSREACRARVAQQVAGEFASTAPAPSHAESTGSMMDEEKKESTIVHGFGIELDEDRKVWAGKLNDDTVIQFNNKELRTRLRISKEATLALIMNLLELEFPDTDLEETAKVEEALLADAYTRDWKKAARAVNFWANDVPEIDGLGPESAIYTLAGMYLTLRDSMRDQQPLGWLQRDSVTRDQSFTQVLPVPSAGGLYQALYGLPVDTEHVATNSARWIAVKPLLRAPADDPQRALFDEIMADLPATPESVDLSIDTIIAKQTATKAQWIRRYAEHLISNGLTAEQAQLFAESSYDPEAWTGVTPEAAAAQDLEQVKSTERAT
jgi:hypothetical protein